MIARLSRIVALGGGLVAAFSLLMILTYSLPESLVRSHMGSSIRQLELEDHSCSSLVGLRSLILDNYTDALMLNLSLRPMGIGALEGAFGNYYQLVEDPTGGQLQLEGLRAAVKGIGGLQTSYARYWHGYQIALRPLLIFFDYGAIRWLNAIVLTVCILVVAALLRYRLSLGIAIAFLVALLSVGIVAVPMSLTFCGVFYVALSGMIAVAFGMDGRGSLRFDLEMFFILGALTSFIDFLTVPVLTLGMPLAVLLLGRMSSDSESVLSRQLLCFFRTSCIWAIGYVGCWIAKWIISSFVLGGHSLLGEAVQYVSYRLNGAEEGITFDRIETLLHNVVMLLPLFGSSQSQGIQWGVVVAACVMPAAIVLIMIVLLVRHMRTDGMQRRIVGLLPVGALPVVWYLVVNNHSRIHDYFTYRALAVTVFVVIASLSYLFDPHYLSGLKVKLESHLRRSP